MPNKEIDEMGIHRNELTDEVEGDYTQQILPLKNKQTPIEPRNGGEISFSTLKITTQADEISFSGSFS